MAEQEQPLNIYDYGFGKNLVKERRGFSTGVVYDGIGDALNTGQLLTGGNLTLKTLNIGNLVRQVAPGDDINAAIDAVSREGGGVVQLIGKTYTLTSSINMKSDVILAGSGVDITILDFADSTTNLFNMNGTSSSIIDNMIVRDLTIQNSNASRGVLVSFADRWSMENVRVHSCGTTGIQIQDCQYYTLYRCRSSSNGASGYFIVGTNSRANNRFSLIACTADANGTNGFRISSGTNDLAWASLLGCVSSGNSTNGFSFDATSASSVEAALLGCVASGNTEKGFVTDSNSQRIRCLGCIADTNTGDGFEMVGAGHGVIGCLSGDVFDIQGAGNFIGNDNTSPTLQPGLNYVIAKNQIQSFMNLNENPATIRKTHVMANDTTASLRQGNIVVLSPNVAEEAERVATTSTNGDKLVWGMADETIASGAFGRILVEGFTTTLYVNNSTASIALGDWLSTYSHAYYAKKAIAGDMAIAIAFSTPSTGTAQISALFVSPRLI